MNSSALSARLLPKVTASALMKNGMAATTPAHPARGPQELRERHRQRQDVQRNVVVQADEEADTPQDLCHDVRDRQPADVSRRLQDGRERTVEAREELRRAEDQCRHLDLAAAAGEPEGGRHGSEERRAQQRAQREDSPHEIRRVIGSHRDLACHVGVDTEAQDREEHGREALGEAEVPLAYRAQVLRNLELDDERDRPAEKQRPAQLQAVPDRDRDLVRQDLARGRIAPRGGRRGFRSCLCLVDAHGWRKRGRRFSSSPCGTGS
jgi:hypothetical protein